MKRLSIYAFAAVASIFVLAGCQKEVLNNAKEDVSNGQFFELFASTGDTKTTNDGLNTNWADGDALTVFHAVAGATSSYGSNDKFTFVTGTDGQFITETLKEDLYDSNDWYALYPYNSFISTPGDRESGFSPIGSSGKSEPQVQTGNNSKAHLAGEYFPLYGKATNVAKDETVNITMKQALAVIKVHVTNSTDESLTVTSVKVTAPDTISLVGTYYINFAGDTPVFTSSGDSYVSNIATLNVTNGVLTKGDTANFYIAVKPFSAKNCAFKVAVNGAEKDLTIGSKGVNFESGKIRKINYTYTGAPKITDGDYVILAEKDSKYYALSSDANSTRRARVELDDYTGGTSYSTNNQKIMWHISPTDGGYKIYNYEAGVDGEKYFGAVDKGINMVSSDAASILTATNQSDNIWHITYVIDKTTEYLSMNGEYGFAFYEGTGEKDIKLVPVTYTPYPTWTMDTVADLEYADTLSYSLTPTTDADSVTVYAYTTSEYSTSCDWISVGFSDGNFTYKATSSNAGESSRTAYVKISTSRTIEGTTYTKDYYTTITQKSNHQYILSFTKNTKASGYASNYNISVNGKDWSAPGNQNLGNYIKIGGASGTNVTRYLYCTSAIGGALSKITFNHGNADSGFTVNSITIKAYSTSDNAKNDSNVVASTTIEYSSGDAYVEVSGEDWNGKYIRIVYDYTHSKSSNKGVILNSVTFDY